MRKRANTKEDWPDADNTALNRSICEAKKKHRDSDETDPLVELFTAAAFTQAGQPRALKTLNGNGKMQRA